MHRSWIVLLVVAACTPKGAPSSGDSGATATATTTAAATAAATAPACRPPELGEDARLAPWTPPAGCKWTTDAGTSTLVRSEAQLVAILGCKSPRTSDIDFEKVTLVVTSRISSPATVGTDAYDDGKSVVFVSRQRSACPGERPPMPVPATYAFLLPAKTARTFAEATCAQVWTCPG